MVRREMVSCVAVLSTWVLQRIVLLNERRDSIEQTRRLLARREFVGMVKKSFRSRAVDGDGKYEITAISIKTGAEDVGRVEAMRLPVVVEHEGASAAGLHR